MKPLIEIDPQTGQISEYADIYYHSMSSVINGRTHTYKIYPQFEIKAYKSPMPTSNQVIELLCAVECKDCFTVSRQQIELKEVNNETINNFFDFFKNENDKIAKNFTKHLLEEK